MDERPIYQDEMQNTLETSSSENVFCLLCCAPCSSSSLGAHGASVEVLEVR